MLKRASMLGLVLVVCSGAWGQKRLAIVEANAANARGNPAVANAESRLVEDLTAKLAGQPGITLIDRASIDRILKEQDFQNSDRSSPDTAARIGKLLGVGQMVMVHVLDASFSTHGEGSGNSSRTMGTVVLRANVKMIDVQTAEILAQPVASFQDSVLVAQTSKSTGFHYGAINVPSQTKTSGGDPKVIEGDEWAKASEAVTGELAAKLTNTVASAPGPKMAAPLVAGIANGSVYINQGANAGIKAGDRFQVMREVSVGLNDPTTGKPSVQKQRICTLTVTNASETNSSGSCAGGLPQAKDVAEPMQ